MRTIPKVERLRLVSEARHVPGDAAVLDQPGTHVRAHAGRERWSRGFHAAVKHVQSYIWSLATLLSSCFANVAQVAPNLPAAPLNPTFEEQ